MTSDSPEDPRDSPFVPEPERPIDDLMAALGEAEQVYLKKLSLNDWQWSENPLARQGGVYIPHEDRDSGFFPPLGLKDRPGGEPPIREIWFDLEWPQRAKTKTARLAHYTSKGQETHLTNVVKGPFQGVSPASFLVIVRKRLGTGEFRFKALVVDSGGAGVDYLRDLFHFGSTFISGFFVPEIAAKNSENRVLLMLSTLFARGRRVR